MNEETSALAKKQAAFQRNQRDNDANAEEEFEIFCSEAMFRIQVLLLECLLLERVEDLLSGVLKYLLAGRNVEYFLPLNSRFEDQRRRPAEVGSLSTYEVCTQHRLRLFMTKGRKIRKNKEAWFYNISQAFSDPRLGGLYAWYVYAVFDFFSFRVADHVQDTDTSWFRHVSQNSVTHECRMQ